jgi:hypothetical protein
LLGLQDLLELFLERFQRVAFFFRGVIDVDDVVVVVEDLDMF